MAQSQAPSGTASEFAASEMPVSELGEASPTPGKVMTYPPYPPYASEPAPPSVADTIIAGRDIRLRHKSLPRQTVRPPPKPARPRGPKATDVKLTRRSARAHARCLRRHGAVLTDRLERMSKPPRRNIICLWREHADRLQPETIARLRCMLDADEPFKPDQAYEYFVNLRKTKKKTTATTKVNQIKKDVLAMCADKRFIWARNATVAFARGIQQRLSRPGRYALADRMLRLSNIVLADICGYQKMRTPSRRCTHPKAKFMMEMADKVAVWIDEVLADSEDRMLMMDFDEDEEVERNAADEERAVTEAKTAATTSDSSADVIGADEAGDAGFTDDFLNMMGGGGLLKGPQPAYLRFTGPMLEAFLILTDSMTSKGDAQLLKHGKFQQTYQEGADELKQTPDFEATEFNTTLSNQLNKDLTATAKPNTPGNLAACMKEMVEICSNYLAQNAEFNKDKGPAFRLLVKTMNTKANEQLYQKEKAARTYGKAAKELEAARGLESDHDDPNLSQAIHSSLSKLVDAVTPAELKADMAETLDVCSKYLSQCAIDEIERGPAFDLLVKELEIDGAAPFTPQFDPLNCKFAAAYVLKSAPGLSSSTPNPETAPIFLQALHRAVDAATPKNLKKDMEDVIVRCSNYLSAFIRDRGKALELLLKVMKGKGKSELVKRENYAMDYATGAVETETAPLLVPFLPVKDISDEAKSKLTTDTESSTPADLKIAMKSLVQDVSRHLSQPVAMRSGVAGERYPLNFLAAVKKSLGTRSLFKYKSFGQTYGDAAEELKYSGPLEYDPKCDELKHQISSEMVRGVPIKLPPSITEGLKPTMDGAAKHLAKVGTEKGEALEYVVKLMKEEGDAPLGQLQGYQQSYKDGARRNTHVVHILGAPIVSTDQMADWHAMMVSLMWNVQAWRDWIQDYINRALNYKHDPNIPPAETEDNWSVLSRRIATEALQWRQYNNFSRQLTLRLALRYRDKQIVSPTRATVKTAIYMDCQKEMLDIIDMFYRWTHWLSAVVKETDNLTTIPGLDLPLHELRWNHFRKKVEEYSSDWIKYNVHLKICWEHKYQNLISEWLPSWEQPGPVWVVSACGAVPSGAVAAGVFDGEVTWVARTTHKCNVLPAALHPSKHCCLVYADGAVHHYTKYQVLCNASVAWRAWRAGSVGARAVRVAPGVHVGRVHYRGSHLLGAVHAPAYRAHVVIFGRPFAFNCYELLVLTED